MQSTRIAEAPMHSRARPTRVAAVALLTAWLAACGHDTLPTTVPADDTGYRALGVQDEAALGVTASGIMADIGCRPLRGRPDSATIAIRLVAPRVKAYQCRGVPTARIRAAVRAVRQMVLANPRWASVQSEAGDGGGGSGYYAYDHMECIWHPAAPPEYGERINADGDFEVYVLVEAQPGYCAWMAIFRYIEPGGGADPGTDTETLPPAPTPAPDTCRSSRDAHYGVLEQKWIQDSLNAVLLESIATDTEIAGRILRDPWTGRLFFQRGVMDPAGTDNCRFTMLPATGLPGEVIAKWHTHPNADDAIVTCRLSGKTGTITTAATGGGSPEDWAMVNDSGIRMYTIDPRHIYRLDPSPDRVASYSNPNQWIRVPSGCAQPSSGG
jgi:hypothetical protein